MSDAYEVSFAHPVERELARLFDEHAVRWLYEPHTFVLESDADGTVREASELAAAAEHRDTERRAERAAA